jgi:hypothetical protein
MSKIAQITPIKDGMSKEQAREAIQVFLSEILDSHEQISQSNVCVAETHYAPRLFQVLKMNDGSSWVQGTGGIQRLIGANYLTKQLQELGIDDWQVVETKYYISSSKQNINCSIKFDNKMQVMVIDSEDFITFSKYVGDVKATSYGSMKQIKEASGYTDYTFFANLRKSEQGPGTIIDTEYNSFEYIGEPIFSAETIELLGGEAFEFAVSDLLN